MSAAAVMTIQLLLAVFRKKSHTNTIVVVVVEEWKHHYSYPLPEEKWVSYRAFIANATSVSLMAYTGTFLVDINALDSFLDRRHPNAPLLWS
jgi:hypothetical protein